MKKFFKIIGEITYDILCNIAYFAKNNLVRFSNVLNLILPYLMYAIGQYVVISRDKFSIGGELFVPLFFTIIIYYLKSFANKIGRGITIPIPEKRFTEVDEDGEVSIENNRIQELILYVADLEDWLERKGLV